MNKHGKTFKLMAAALLLAAAGNASAKKCVEVTVCDAKGKNCHPEQMCSVYSEQPGVGGVQTRQAAPPPPSGEPQSLLGPAPAPVKKTGPACDDTPVAGKPRKVCP